MKQVDLARKLNIHPVKLNRILRRLGYQHATVRALEGGAYVWETPEQIEGRVRDWLAERER